LKPAISRVELVSARDLGPADGEKCHGGLIVRAELRPGEGAAIVCRSPRRALAAAHAAVEYLADRGVTAQLVMGTRARQATRGAASRLAAEQADGPHRALVDEFAHTWSAAAEAAGIVPRSDLH
jgi:hypothetical protein